LLSENNKLVSTRLSRILSGVTFLLFCALASHAQDDTLRPSLKPKGEVRRDSLQTKSNAIVTGDTIAKKEPKVHSPKKAAIYSACLPGLGQVYNSRSSTINGKYYKGRKSLWKVPVIYAGFAGMGYFIYTTNNKYQTFRLAYRTRVDNDSTTTDNLTQYTTNDLKTARDYWHRYRDLSIVGAVALYALQVVDATVDGHLYTFDVSDDLTLQWQPVPYMCTVQRRPVHGVGIRLTF
jgi:hypothetical protein